MGIHELLQLRTEAETCTACSLADTRTNVVFGVGNTASPKVCFIGEGPGETEDLLAQPFCGMAGRRLTGWIEWMGFKRHETYLTNTVLCHPPNNRKPLADELTSCRRFLESQIRLVQPQVLVALGATAAQSLLGTKNGITSLRGGWLDWCGFPVRATYHPSYVDRVPSQQTEVLKDLQAVLTWLSDPPPF